MNLQVNSPYTKCPYRCPYCVAGVKEDYPFSDTLYRSNVAEYLVTLAETILKYNITTIVLTGDTEPTLFPQWLKEVCYILRGYGGLNVELQTKNYRWTETYGVIKTIAYSNDSIPTRPRLPHNFTVRDTFLWNRELTSASIVKYFKSQPNVNQCTVKQLVFSSYGIPHIDEYIQGVKKELTHTDKLILQDNGIWVDEDCSASENRYLIYRADGKVYQKWSDTESIA